MKNLITIILLSLSALTFSQTVTEKVTDAAKDLVISNVDTNSILDSVDTIEELFVHYSKEVAETSKSVTKSSLQLIEQGVELLFTESAIIVKQFIIFTSIQHLLYLIVGLLLIFKIPKLLFKWCSMDKDEAIEHNTNIKNEGFTYVEPYYQILGYYFRGYTEIVLTGIANITFVIAGIIILFTHLLPFIKVTFFSKLYLIELLTKMI